MHVMNLLNQLDANELLGGLLSWKGPGPSPYTVHDLHAFCNISSSECKLHSDNHEEFKIRLSSMNDDEKEILRDHVHKLFWNILLGQHNEFTRIDQTCAQLKTIPLSKSASVLDVGSSHGLHGLLHLVHRHNLPYKFAACDVLPANLKLLSLFGIETFYLSAQHAATSDIPIAKYDLVMCNEVLEHLDQSSEDAVLQMMMKWVRPGGHIMITFPVDANPKAYDRNVDPFGHVRQPSVETIIQKLNGHVVKCDKISTGKQNCHYLLINKR